MLLLIAYLVMGVVALYGMVIVHFLKAEMKGYDCLNWWNENIDAIRDNSILSKIMFWVYVVLWPARVLMFTFVDAKIYYDLYPMK